MIRINLLKPGKKDIGEVDDISSIPGEPKEPKINIAAIAGALAISIGLIGFLFFTKANELKTKGNLLKEKEARKKELEHVLDTLKELEKTKARLDMKIKTISALKSKQRDGVIIMDEISNALPGWVWLTGINFKGNSITLTGKAMSNNLIADFINNINSKDVFLNTRFNSSVRIKQAGQDIFTFSLTFQYKNSTSLKKAA